MLSFFPVQGFSSLPRAFAVSLLFGRSLEREVVCGQNEVDAVKEIITAILKDTRNKKKHCYTETVEFQFGLKNYDSEKERRFSGSIKLPHIPRPIENYDPQKDKRFSGSDKLPHIPQLKGIEKIVPEHMDAKLLQKMNKKLVRKEEKEKRRRRKTRMNGMY